MSAFTRAWLQHALPKNPISRSIYRIARSRRPWLKNALIRWFARTYAIDLDEAETADLDAYPTLNAFFTRALRDGVRPIAGDERTVVSPADGTLSEHGTIADGQLLQAKGMRYAVAELLGEDERLAARFEHGAFLTVYLAPHDYHRVHVPVAGKLVRTTYLPGERFSVSLATAAAIPRLFCRNERVVCWLDTAAGEAALVLVGALNVSSVSTVNLGEIASGVERRWRESPALPLARGAELGRFNLGSTVVMLFPRGAVAWNDALAAGARLRVGEALGTIADAGGALGGTGAGGAGAAGGASSE